MSIAERLSLRGRTLLVTGGSGDIGAAVVAALHDAGADVLSVDLPGRPLPAGARALPCDLGDPAAIAALQDQLPERIDSLVHCAGIARDGVLWKMTDADWRQVLATNLDSAFFLLRLLVPRLRAAGGGSVVFVASINGERGKFGQANYAASKAGLIALGKTAAKELGRFGIRCNCVAPGLIDTAMTRGLPDEVRARAIAETALGRAGSPADVAGAVLFLCSPLAAHVTGQVLRVDGGQCTA